MRLSILAGIAAAFVAVPATADAGFHFSILHGAYYSHPHHWYTNDGRKHQWGENENGSHHHHGNDEDNHKSEHNKEIDRKVRVSCNRYHAEYIMRHGFSTPRSLRHEHGCVKWMDDAYYHDSHPETLSGFVSELSNINIP